MVRSGARGPMARLTKLTEAQIAKARAEGQFDDLEGAGKPLPKREGEGFLDAGLSVGLRAMSQAGVVPEEIELKRQMDALRARYRVASDEGEKRELMKALADLNLKYEIAREARQKFFKG